MTPVLARMLDHRFTKAHASGYLDGELDQPGRARIERHTSVCPKCRALISSLRRILEELPRLSQKQRASAADGVLEHLHRCA